MIHRNLTIFITFLGVFIVSFQVSYAQHILPNTNINNLKQQITLLQDSLEISQQQVDSIETIFDLYNEDIYQLQKNLESDNNPLLNIRLDRALRSAREIGNNLVEHNETLRRYEAQLQALYRKCIQVIEQEVIKLTAEKDGIKSIEAQRKHLEKIEALESEKSSFHQLLEKKPIKGIDWRSLVIEENDSPRRIRLKKAIMDEQLVKLSGQIIEHENRKKTIEKDVKLYQEMLEFYNELNQGIDDDQEFLDQNRIEELNDRLDDLTSELKVLEGETEVLNRDLIVLRQRLTKFRKMSANKE